MLVCRFVGLVFKAVGQPTVIGEIIAGILLGPSAMGLAYPCPTGSTAPTSRYPAGAPCDPRNPTLKMFPTHTPHQGGPNNIRNYLNVCAQLGVVVFMFVVGLEVDVLKLKRTSGKAGLIALASVALPFCLGTFALAPHLYDTHNVVDGKAVPSLSFKLFVGTSMSVTAFPVLARIITEKGLQRLNIGALAVACAALTDVVAWALLAIVLAVQESQSDGGELDYKPVLVQLALIVVFIIVQFLVVSPLMRFTVLRHFVKRGGSLTANRLAWVLISMLLSAWLMHTIGFHAMLGSFLFGLAFPRGSKTPFLHTIVSKIEPFAICVLLPLFFVVTGLSIDLTQLKRSRLDLLYILLVASGGKFLGSGVVAKLCGLSWRHSVAVGVLMNTRGLTEIVVLNIAKDAGILDDEVFTLLVLMAVITTAATGPLLRLIFPPSALIREHEAAIAATAEGRSTPAEDGAARLVVLPHDIASTPRLLSAAVATLAPGMRAHVSVARFSSPADVEQRTEMGTGLLLTQEEQRAKEALEAQLADIARPNLSSAVTSITTENMLGDTIVHLRAVAPQLVVTDWPASAEERQKLRALVAASPCTVVVWGGGGAAGAPAERSAPDKPVADVSEASTAPQQPRWRFALALLHRESAQDAFVDAASKKLQAALDAACLRLPPWMRFCWRPDDDDDGAEAAAGELATAPSSPRVISAESAGVVTAQTMAVAAASSLSPKFSKLIVTGWPAAERERAELVSFVHDVERDASTAMRRASRQASHLNLRRSASGPDVAVQLTVKPPVSPAAPSPPRSPPPHDAPHDSHA